MHKCLYIESRNVQYKYVWCTSKINKMGLKPTSHKPCYMLTISNSLNLESIGLIKVNICEKLKEKKIKYVNISFFYGSKSLKILDQ